MGKKEKTAEKRKYKDEEDKSSENSDHEEDKKKRKLEKKLEKLNKKIQKREDVSSSSTITTSSSIEKLTMNDYYRKNQEFRLWLLNNKKLRIEDDLENTEEIQHYFKKFIKVSFSISEEEFKFHIEMEQWKVE